MQAAPLLPPNAGPKSRPKCSTAFSQAVAIQRVLLADALSPETTASARAQVARAWEVLEERKRILRMKPKPKDVDVSARAKSKSPCSQRPLVLEDAFEEDPAANGGKTGNGEASS